MYRAKFQYQGTELEETKAWYEEYFGAHRAERKQVMDGLQKQHTRRDTVYALYRTVVMEDDGWEAGYNAGDAYLMRSFNDRKDSKAATIRTWEGKLNALKERQATNQNYLDRGIAAYRRVGGQALRNKIKQIHDEVKLDAQRIQAVENKINGERGALGQDKTATQNLIKKHRESMTFHRLNAYQKRQNHGRLNYLGTASPTGVR